jgi:hypothetical protein
MANSSPDVKALFNAPAYVYNLEDHEETQNNNFVQQPDYGQTSEYGQASDYSQHSDYWTPTTPLPPIVRITTVSTPRYEV